MKHIDYYRQIILGGGSAGESGGGGITPAGTLELDYGELEYGQSVDEIQDVTDKAEVHVAVSAKEPTGGKRLFYTLTPDNTAGGTRFNSSAEDVKDNAQVFVQADLQGFIPTPTETKEINITQNGDSTEDVTQYANAHIVVNVPSEVPEPTGTAELAYTLEKGVYSLDETADVSGKAEAHVTVDASALEPSGVKEVSVTQNGEVTEDVKDYASVKITTQVESGGGEDTATMLITDQLESYSA